MHCPGIHPFGIVSGVSRTKIEEVTLDALRTRQSLVKGERLVRHEMRAVLDVASAVRGAFEMSGFPCGANGVAFAAKRSPL